MLTVVDHGSTLSWFDAKAGCEAIGLQLATVSSAEQQAELSTYTGRSIWIGLNELDQYGVFKWVGTGQSPTYTNWGSGSPNGGGADGECVFVWSGDYRWYDRNCIT
eukprot:4057735-Pleurochrysis_carterae.AAC.1